MAGALAEAFYGGVPQEVAKESLLRLDDFLRGIVSSFYSRIIPNQTLPRLS
jgi:hypothetical protein